MLPLSTQVASIACGVMWLVSGNRAAPRGTLAPSHWPLPSSVFWPVMAGKASDRTPEFCSPLVPSPSTCSGVSAIQRLLRRYCHCTGGNGPLSPPAVVIWNSSVSGCDGPRPSSPI